MNHSTDKKISQAVALQYDETSAPRVVAKGNRELAEKIIALAKEHQIPLHHDPELTALLSQLDLGEEIPRTLYLAVAQIIAFAYQLREKYTAKKPKNDTFPD